MKYLEGYVESLLLVDADVPLLRSTRELALVHAEGEDYLRALGHLRVRAFDIKNKITKYF